MIDINRGIGKNIKKYRKANNLTCAALASKSGISAASISRYETGKQRPTDETLEKLADALNITADTLRTIKIDAPSWKKNNFETIEALNNFLSKNDIYLNVKNIGSDEMLFSVEYMINDFKKTYIPFSQDELNDFIAEIYRYVSALLYMRFYDKGGEDDQLPIIDIK